MNSNKPTIEEAVKDFLVLRNCAPFRFGGVWFVIQNKDGFTAYRTLKAAKNNATCNQIWRIIL